MGRFSAAPSHPYAPAGAIFFARGTGLLAKSIRWAEREKDEEASWANHVGIITSPGYLVPPHGDHEYRKAVASESLWHIKNHVWWDAHKDEQGYAVAVYAPEYDSHESRTRAVQNALTRTGQKYGWWRLFTFLGEKLTKLPWTKLHFQSKRIVCSNHVGRALQAGGVRLPEDPGSLDPDDLHDFVISHPRWFVFLGWAIVPGRRP